MFTASQIAAIIMLLQAFGVDPATVNQVLVDLSPSTITIAPTLTQAPTASTTPTFGSTHSATITQTDMPKATVAISTPVSIEQPSPIRVDVAVTNSPTKIGQGAPRLEVNVYRNEVYEKGAVLVESNYPGLPTQFTLNAPKQINFFCAADAYEDFPNHGCANDVATREGTFDFTFNYEGQKIVKQVQILP